MIAGSQWEGLDSEILVQSGKKTWIRGKECTQWMVNAKFNQCNVQCAKFSGAHEERLGWKI